MIYRGALLDLQLSPYSSQFSLGNSLNLTILDKSVTKEGPNVRRIFGKLHYLNIFNNHGHCELKLDQHLYFRGINKKSKRLFKLWLFWTKSWVKKVQVWPSFYQNYLFSNILTKNCNFYLKLGQYWYFHFYIIK